MKRSIFAYLVCIVLVSMTSRAQVNWINAAGGNWTNDASWSTGTAPTAADTAQHTSVGGTISVTTAAEANQLNVSHDNTATVSVGAGGSLVVGANAEIGNTGTTGTGKLVVDGGSVSIGGNIDFGRFGAARQGIGELNSGSVTVNGYTALGGFNAGAIGTLTINGGTYTALNDTFLIGRTGQGTLNMNGGTLQLDTGSTVWNPLRIGDDGTGDATINLNGGAIYTRGVQMDWSETDAGTSTINLTGGLLQLEGGFTAALRMDDDAQMVFDKGEMRWKGNRISDIATLVDGGYFDWSGGKNAMLTENWDASWTNGASVLYADYNDANAGYTTVWAAIPEPATIGMVFAVSGGMFFVRRRLM